MKKYLLFFLLFLYSCGGGPAMLGYSPKPLNMPLLPTSPYGSNGAFYSIFVDDVGVKHFFMSMDAQASGNAHSTIYYNKMIAGVWQHGENIPLLNFGDITSTAVNSVLYDPTAPYNGHEWIMFLIVQPEDRAAFWTAYGGSAPCIVEEPASAGWGMLYVSFSHNPESGWTTPCQFSLDGSHVVLSENSSAINHNGILYITVFEGSFPIMVNNLNGLTYAYIIQANPATPTRGTRIGSGYLSADGITGFNPGIGLTSPHKTMDYPMMYNLDTTFDSATGDFYLARSYAYPFDVSGPSGSFGGAISGEIPCNGVTGGSRGMALIPNRSQLYKMHINNVTELYSGTWELISDYGRSNGYYASSEGGGCLPTPIQANQTNINGDVNTMNIVRDRRGFIDASKTMIISYESMPTVKNPRAYEVPFQVKALVESDTISPGIEYYKSLITSEYQNSDKFMRWFSVTLQMLRDGVQVVDALATRDFDLDFAFGKQLDIIGEIVGVKRQVSFQPSDGSSPILGDQDYQILLRAKVARNQWNGLIDNLQELWRVLFPSGIIIVRDNQDMSMNVFLTGNMSPVQKDMVIHDLIVPRPEGVLINYFFGEAPIFGFDIDNEFIGGFDHGHWISTPGTVSLLPFFGFDSDNAVVAGFDLGHWAT